MRKINIRMTTLIVLPKDGMRIGLRAHRLIIFIRDF